MVGPSFIEQKSRVSWKRKCVAGGRYGANGKLALPTVSNIVPGQEMSFTVGPQSMPPVFHRPGKVARTIGAMALTENPWVFR